MERMMRFVGLLREHSQRGTISRHFFDHKRVETSFGLLCLLVSRLTLLLPFCGAYIDLQSLQLKLAEMPGRAQKPQQRPFRCEFFDRDQRRRICAALVMQYHSFTGDLDVREYR